GLPGRRPGKLLRPERVLARRILTRAICRGRVRGDQPPRACHSSGYRRRSPPSWDSILFPDVPGKARPSRPPGPNRFVGGRKDMPSAAWGRVVRRAGEPSGVDLVFDYRRAAAAPAPQGAPEQTRALLACYQKALGHDLPNQFVVMQAFARLLLEQEK